MLTAVRATSDGRLLEDHRPAARPRRARRHDRADRRCEEFAAAVAGRILMGGDADLALCTVHKTLEELSRFRHDLGGWLAYKHIFDVWPPYS